jgi:putative ABC transport system permease protein
VVSVLVEALLLALLGAGLGAWLAYVLFEGDSVSTMSGFSPSKITYALVVTPDLVLLGIGAAGLIGILGGLFPALRAARLPVATAIRATT